MIDPVQSQIAATTPSSSSDPVRPTSEASGSGDFGALARVQTASTSSNSETSPQSAQSSSSGAGTDAQSASEASPLRLLIEHDKATNQYVYKLYDSSGRIVREIPQESLAEAQKQASGSPGALFDTKV